MNKIFGKMKITDDGIKVFKSSIEKVLSMVCENMREPLILTMDSRLCRSTC